MDDISRYEININEEKERKRIKTGRKKEWEENSFNKNKKNNNSK